MPTYTRGLYLSDNFAFSVHAKALFINLYATLLFDI